MYIKDNMKEPTKEFEVLECPSCKNVVSTTADRCWKCGNAIEHSTAKKVVEAAPQPKKGWEELEGKK